MCAQGNSICARHLFFMKTRLFGQDKFDLTHVRDAEGETVHYNCKYNNRSPNNGLSILSKLIDSFVIQILTEVQECIHT